VKRLLLDDLTGAYQRAGLSGILDELADEHAKTGADYALAMIDVDHLKTLNDVYGHATGDAALKAVAQRAASVLRQHDLLFR
jgi:diguanylate cyclase (GGDEF)-like protein